MTARRQYNAVDISFRSITTNNVSVCEEALLLQSFELGGDIIGADVAMHIHHLGACSWSLAEERRSRNHSVRRHVEMRK